MEHSPHHVSASASLRSAAVNSLLPTSPAAAGASGAASNKVSGICSTSITTPTSTGTAVGPSVGSSGVVVSASLQQQAGAGVVSVLPASSGGGNLNFYSAAHPAAGPATSASQSAVLAAAASPKTSISSSSCTSTGIIQPTPASTTSPSRGAPSHVYTTTSSVNNSTSASGAKLPNLLTSSWSSGANAGLVSTSSGGAATATGGCGDRVLVVDHGGLVHTTSSNGSSHKPSIHTTTSKSGTTTAKTSIDETNSTTAPGPAPGDSTNFLQRETSSSLHHHQSGTTTATTAQLHLQGGGSTTAAAPGVVPGSSASLANPSQHQQQLLFQEQQNKQLDKQIHYYNQEVAKLHVFKQKIQHQFDVEFKHMSEKLEKIQQERDDLLHQGLDGEELTQSLQRRLADVMKEMSAMAEITSEQDKALTWLIQYRLKLEEWVVKKSAELEVLQEKTSTGTIAGPTKSSPASPPTSVLDALKKEVGKEPLLASPDCLEETNSSSTSNAVGVAAGTNLLLQNQHGAAKSAITGTTPNLNSLATGLQQGSTSPTLNSSQLNNLVNNRSFSKQKMLLLDRKRSKESDLSISAKNGDAEDDEEGDARSV
ncbi:unnamed protein product [Amoebophrya sp. A120]|nr:unnamed protein product [Amoebophrya sp. A120]|eukprot:GSA120T00009017001.1